MLYISLISSVIFAIIVSNSTLSSTSDSNNNSKWEFVEMKNEISIYERWIEITDEHKTRERKGEFQLNSEVEYLIPLIREAHEVPKWMNSTRSVEIIEDTGESWISYIRFEAPWPFKERDLVAEFHLRKDLLNNKTIVIVKAMPGLIPLKEDVIRIESYIASWQFQKTTNGLKVIFTAMSDTPPIVPRWIQDPITQKMFWETLDNFRSQAIMKSTGQRNFQLQTELK